MLRGIFSPAGERIAFQAIGKDVTREVELEAKVVDSERMQAIGQLAGGIAHDFNNLIFVIWSCVEIASARIAGHAADGVADAADNLLIIRQAADRAAVLTRQLAAVGRNEALRVSAVDLSVLLQNLAPLLKRLLPSTIALELRCAAALPAVLVDPTQIERVIINLVTNARDATASGGRVVVTTAAETVEADDASAHPPIRAGRYAVLAVTDTGVGMDAATARRIFEPFFTTKREGRGTGLGLTTAYGIVEQAGGRIRVETAPGAGTTFFVYIPEAADVAVAPSRRAPGTCARARPHPLLRGRGQRARAGGADAGERRLPRDAGSGRRAGAGLGGQRAGGCGAVPAAGRPGDRQPERTRPGGRAPAPPPGLAGGVLLGQRRPEHHRRCRGGSGTSTSGTACRGCWPPSPRQPGGPASDGEPAPSPS